MNHRDLHYLHQLLNVGLHEDHVQVYLSLVQHEVVEGLKLRNVTGRQSDLEAQQLVSEAEVVLVNLQLDLVLGYLQVEEHQVVTYLINLLLEQWHSNVFLNKLYNLVHSSQLLINNIETSLLNFL